jgi:hypothetical protein
MDAEPNRGHHKKRTESMARRQTPINDARLLHPKPRQFAKERRPYGSPVALPKESPTFIPPFFTNRTNLKISLGVIDPHVNASVQKSGRLVFHTVGDTGGVHGTDVQEAIAEEMEHQIGKAGPDDKPALLYHLGDVIYFNGQSELYRTQFYEPYQYYQAPIFAIPGNHDGDTRVRPGDTPDSEPSLTGFRLNFCDDQPKNLFPYRQTMTQPYVYWTLETPVATIVGLYSNVDGTLDGRGTDEQQRWLAQQLREADKDKCLLIAVHHPPYSLDGTHGGSPDVLVALDTAIQDSARYPDAVFSGHVHNYQRFKRVVNNREIPYVVAGAGGYANQPKLLHRLQRDRGSGKSIEEERLPFQTTEAGVTFESFNRSAGGFLRVTIDGQSHTLIGEYFLVPFDKAPPAKPFDRFTLNWQSHKMT